MFPTFLHSISIPNFSPISVPNLHWHWSRGEVTNVAICQFSYSSVKFMLPFRSSAKYYQLQPAGTNTDFENKYFSNILLLFAYHHDNYFYQAQPGGPNTKTFKYKENTKTFKYKKIKYKSLLPTQIK